MNTVSTSVLLFAGSQTESKDVETRTGVRRETDTTTSIETKTVNVAETTTGST